MIIDLNQGFSDDEHSQSSDIEDNTVDLLGYIEEKSQESVTSCSLKRSREDKGEENEDGPKRIKLDYIIEDFRDVVVESLDGTIYYLLSSEQMHNNHINLNNAQDKAREHKQASKNPGYEKDAPVAAIYAYKHTDMKDFINSIVKFESPDTPVIKVDVKDEKVARSNFAELNSLTIKTKTLKWLRCVLHAIVFEAELIKKPDLTESKFNFNRIRQIKSGRLILMFQRILYPEESELKIMINSGQINKLSQLFTYGEHRGWKEIYKEFEKDLIAIKKRIK